MSKITPELIRIVSLNVYKALVNANDEYLENPSKPYSITVKYGLNSAFNFEDNAIRIRLEVLLDGLNKKEQKIGLHADYGLEFHFVIDNLNDFIEEKDDRKYINGQFGGTLMGIAYSTARGIILERTQGTYFDGVILPVIDPKELIENK